MKIVFFGSSNFAAPSLKAVLSSTHTVSCVVTQPDREKGRGLHLGSTVIKALAIESGLKIYQPCNVNAREAINFLKELKPDLFLVISYGQILSKEILDIPKMLALNVHASLLPKYRGAAPINWAIINGDKITGVTIMKMIKEMDAGPVMSQKKVDISENDTSNALGQKLSAIGAELLLETLKSVEDKTYKIIPQDESKMSLAPKLKKKDGLIDWAKTAQDIYNLIRGCFEWPGAFTYYQGKLLKIYKARISALVVQCHSGLPGQIIDISKEGILVATGKGSLVIEELQLEGKRRMEAREFIAGHKISVRDMFIDKNRLHLK